VLVPIDSCSRKIAMGKRRNVRNGHYQDEDEEERVRG